MLWESVNRACHEMKRHADNLLLAAHAMEQVMPSSPIAKLMACTSDSLLGLAAELSEESIRQSMSDFRDAQERGGLMLKAALSGLAVGRQCDKET